MIARLRRFYFAAWLAMQVVVGVPAINAADPEPTPLFDPRRFAPVNTATPQPLKIVQKPPGKPTPRKVILGGIGVFAVVGGVMLLLSIRMWRSSNLFGRIYRFPAKQDAKPRLGGSKCGGHMATVSWGGAPPANSGRENS